ncbi:helix-turn-helix domain-containing protein [Gracilibacillus alcaliphilus]|uniref:helix-turn-helix domain-containing protein n=1 Tax=Gracilibacillus alcaliphilus TaxID=1401441 RepID=UPI0019573AA9|nr:helix-turn-helix domain-containing protein [Gracilibacillus alcaliphilus]MBM7678995.1 two-component system response regulator YesN [Gracilibacillus alcaliphilus]
MYRIMLIDDDVPMLRYLEKLVRDINLEVEVCSAEYSSMKALDRFEQTLPDIVLSDIGLPQLDGLELSEKLKQIKPDIRIIFLTCHESFDYARRAMEMSADDYLLKDELDKEQLMTSIQKSLQHLRQSQNQYDLQSFKETFHKNKYVLRQNFLEQLMDSKQVEHVMKEGSKLGIKWEFPHFFIGRVLLNYAKVAEYYAVKDIPIIKYGIYNIAEEIAKGFQGITPIMDHERDIYLFLNFRYSLSQKHLQQFQTYMLTVEEKVKEILRISICTIYHPYRMEKEEMQAGILALRDQPNQTFYSNEARAAFEAVNWSIDSRQLLQPIEMKIMKAFKVMDLSQLKRLLEELYRVSMDYQIHPKKVIELAELCLARMEVDQQHAGKLEDFKYYMTRAAKITDLLQLLSASIIFYAQSRKQTSNNKLQLQEIEQYIVQHLSKNLTSADMAKHLYLNPSYFSRYFKKLSGQNFTDYIQKYKIDLAQNMLLEDKTIEDVASELGFSDRTYFSKIFKKHTGYSPGEYKTQATFV